MSSKSTRNIDEEFGYIREQKGGTLTTRGAKRRWKPFPIPLSSSYPIGVQPLGCPEVLLPQGYPAHFHTVHLLRSLFQGVLVAVKNTTGFVLLIPRTKAKGDIPQGMSICQGRPGVKRSNIKGPKV